MKTIKSATKTTVVIKVPAIAGPGPKYEYLRSAKTIRVPNSRVDYVENLLSRGYHAFIPVSLPRG